MPQNKLQQRKHRNGKTRDRDTIAIPPPPRARPRKLGMPLEVRFRRDQEPHITDFAKEDGVAKADIVRTALDYYIRARRPKSSHEEIPDHQYAYG